MTGRVIATSNDVVEVPPSQVVIGRLEELGCNPRVVRGRFGDAVRFKWTANCPAHDDRDRKFTVEAKDLGFGHERVLIGCYVCQDQERIRQAIGLPWAAFTTRTGAAQQQRESEHHMASLVDEAAADLSAKGFGDERALNCVGATERVLTDLSFGIKGRHLVIPERDERGRICNVVRYLPRDDRQIGEPKFLVEAGARRGLVFRPDRVREAGEVWFAEGPSKAAALLAVAGEPITWPSAKHWRDDWASVVHTGQIAYVVADADDSGREGATVVAESLARKAASVHVIELSPDLVGDGGDVVDLVREHGLTRTRTLLRSLVREARHVEGPKMGRPPVAIEEAKRFLVETLAHGPLPATEVQRQAAQLGISAGTLKRAKEKRTGLGVKSVRLSDGTWQWVLPESAELPPSH